MTDPAANIEFNVGGDLSPKAVARARHPLAYNANATEITTGKAIPANSV